MRQTQRPLLRSLFSGLLALGLPLGGALVLASVPGGVARAGDLKVRLAGIDALRPSALASATAADKHLYTLRELDPLVPQKYTTIAAKADKDVTVAIYGAGDPSLAFKFGATIRLAGGRAVPATVVVPPGTPVFFRNDDPFTHHIVGKGLERDLKPGESHKLVPEGKGVTIYGDTLIPSVKAWIAVDDGVIANVWPQPDGSLKVPDMAAAEFTIKAWFEGNAKASTSFKVPATGSVEIKDPLAVGPVPPSSSSSAK